MNIDSCVQIPLLPLVTLGKSLYSQLLLSTQEYKWVPVRAEMVIVNDLAAVRRNIVIIIVVIVVIIIIKYQPKCGTYQDMARGVFDEMVE